MNFILWALLFSFSAAANIVIDENTIVSHLDHVPGVQSLQERLISAEKLKGSLTRSFMPSINLSYGQEKYSVGPYHGVVQPYGGIEAKINVFNSGKDVLENDVREKETELAKLDVSITRAKILSEARIALAQMAYLNELFEIIDDARKLNSKNVNGAQKRINAGLSTKTDLIDFRQQEVSLIQEQESIKYEQGVISRLLAVLLGIDPTVKFSVDSINPHPDHLGEEKTTVGAAKSKILRKAQLYSEIAHIETKTAERWWSPKLELYSYALRFTQKEREYPTPSQRNDVSVGFRFTLPIFDGGEGIREAQSRTALSRSAEHQLRQRSLEVEKDTLDAVKKLELAHTLIHGAEENVNLVTEYRLAIIQEYSKGVKNSPDVLQATQRWIEAKTKFAAVKKSYQIAHAEALYLKSLSEN